MGYNGDKGIRGSNGSKEKRPRKSSAERNQVVWDGFIDISLTDDQKDAFRQWRLDTETELPGMLESIAVAGHKITLNYVQSNDNFSASITGQLRGVAGTAQTASAFGRDVTTALQMICFKHFVIAHEDWTTVAAQPSVKDEFG